MPLNTNHPTNLQCMGCMHVNSMDTQHVYDMSYTSPPSVFAILAHKKFSCCREAMQCCMLLDVLISHSRSLKLTQNYIA